MKVKVVKRVIANMLSVVAWCVVSVGCVANNNEKKHFSEHITDGAENTYELEKFIDKDFCEKITPRIKYGFKYNNYEDKEFHWAEWKEAEYGTITQNQKPIGGMNDYFLYDIDNDNKKELIIRRHSIKSNVDNKLLWIIENYKEKDGRFYYENEEYKGAIKFYFYQLPVTKKILWPEDSGVDMYSIGFVHKLDAFIFENKIFFVLIPFGDGQNKLLVFDIGDALNISSTAKYLINEPKHICLFNKP